MPWERILTIAFFSGLLGAGVRLAVPVLIAALGETFAERAGVLNIGIEGMMLIGALSGFVGSYYTGSAWLGLLTGMLGAGLFSLIHAYLAITLGADQVVSGIAINLLALGLATFLNRAIFGLPMLPPSATPFRAVTIPVLSDMPLLGPLLFNHHMLVYVGLLLVPLTAVVLFKTTFGLRISAAGEDPRGAEAAGINVARIRYLSVFIGGLLAGMGGVCLSLANLNMFKESIIAGRGYIAIAVVMFARWNPWRALVAALLFGMTDAFQLYLQSLGVRAVPPQLLVSLPYLATILVLLGRFGRGSMPKALAVPYLKES